MEIDFQKHEIRPSALIYMHPNQVHRILAFENVRLSCLAMTNEQLNPEYLKLLEEITPVVPLALNEASFSIVSNAAALCLQLAERKQDKLYHSFLKDSCNALVALVISIYTARSKPGDRLSRFETVTKTFLKLLERDYTEVKTPSAYAQKLHLSAHYLNECVKNTTGHTVSYHI